MKIKTHKASSKRFKLTKTGKVTHRKQGDNAHLKTNKSYHQKARRNNSVELTNKNEAKKIKRFLNK